MENENLVVETTTVAERMDTLIEDILQLLEEKKYMAARQLLLENNAVDIAEVLEEIMDEMDVDRAVIMFRTLPKDISADVFAYMNSEDQVDIIGAITYSELNYIMEELAFDDLIDVLEELPANLVDKILNQTTKEERDLINTFLKYPENSAGSLMTIDYVELSRDMTVAQAMAHIKEVGIDSETVYTCYVKDNKRHLEGIVSLRALVVAPDDDLVEEYMHEDIMAVNVYEDQEEVSNLFKRYGYLAIPVVDNENRIVGIITVDDIMDVVEEETTEDIERMAGVIDFDDSDTEYLDMSVWRHVKARLPWLFFLMCSYVITGGIISGFEEALSKMVCLVSYMPMLMGTGGNSGSQSATLIIRGMSLDEIDPSDWLKVLWKELRISCTIGVLLSILNFARICLMDGEGPMVALAVSASMFVIVIAAKSIGGLLPMAAKRLGIDPALMASPMISSLTDMVSVVTYFTMATAILGI
ncbi:MAG: magnesium transporter [Firmicutes bacterium]|nr:magnesium transporter [Bacillota bacterium]MBQ2271820.1 magnesium transporter [Bacillota bacterium]MBQ5796515.1 magnesium transporter [Bacillota bacterium]MBR5001644.1 magnesium transporter [Bacillota bacterium]